MPRLPLTQIPERVALDIEHGAIVSDAQKGAGSFPGAERGRWRDLSYSLSAQRFHLSPESFVAEGLALARVVA